MSTTYEATMREVLQRLRGSPPLIDDPERIRRYHRTVVPPESGEAVYLLDGLDYPVKGSRCQREGIFVVAILLRADDPEDRLDAIKVEVYARLKPASGYPEGVTLTPGRIIPSTEIADRDASRIDCEFTFCYAGTEWALGED